MSRRYPKRGHRSTEPESPGSVPPSSRIVSLAVSSQEDASLAGSRFRQDRGALPVFSESISFFNDLKLR